MFQPGTLIYKFFVCFSHFHFHVSLSTLFPKYILQIDFNLVFQNRHLPYRNLIPLTLLQNVQLLHQHLNTLFTNPTSQPVIHPSDSLCKTTHIYNSLKLPFMPEKLLIQCCTKSIHRRPDKLCTQTANDFDQNYVTTSTTEILFTSKKHRKRRENCRQLANSVSILDRSRCVVSGV